MRIFLPLTFIICIFAFSSTAQITFPVVRANFGVEADLSTNFYNNNPQPAVDDWFSRGFTGTGKAVIDTTGAAAIIAGYSSNPSSRKNAFARLMAVPAYTVVNNRLLLDAVFHRDYHGSDSTVFGGGSNKNGMSPALWNSPGPQGIPDKNDILDAMVHVRRAGPNASDSLWMFTGLSLENTTGNRFFDFELYQTDITFNKATGTFSNYGPNEGHTAWTLDAAGNIIKPGDIIFTAEFGSSMLTLVEARIWIKKTSLSITPATFKWGGQVDGDGSGSLYGYANILPKTVGAFYTGLQNNGLSTWAGAFSLVRVDETVVTSYLPNQFMEFSVNLTKLGIEPADFSNNLCGSPFRRVLIKTRSSTSFTAELKDFIAPFRLFDYKDVDANAHLTYFCGMMPTTSIYVENPNSSSIYQWTTSNGNIVGTTTGAMISVNAPGTYYVRQQLHLQCPYFSMDSVTIYYAPVCMVLKNEILDLKAEKSGTDNHISWLASSNQEASRYVIEYSIDNIHFITLTDVAATEQPGKVQYHFYHPGGIIKSSAVSYRVISVSKLGEMKYSNIVTLRVGEDNNRNITIYPNPVKGQSWISYNATKQELGSLIILDQLGRKVKAFEVTLLKGENVIKLPFANELPNGTYMVQIKTSENLHPARMVIQR